MSKTSKAFVVFGALSLAIAAMLSAYGFHGLAKTASPEQLDAWNWAIRMQSYHSLGLLLIAILLNQLGRSLFFGLAGCLFILGIVIFSGSIYLVSLGGPEAMIEIAPAGGTSFMVGWVLVAIGAWRASSQ